MSEESVRSSGWVGRGLLGLCAVLACTPETFEIALPSTSGEGSTTVVADASSSGEATETTAGPGSGSTDGSDSSSDTDDCVPVDDGWWDADWAKRRRLEIDPSVLSGVQQDFPVLVRMPADGLGPSWGERGGDDIRVRSEDPRVPLVYDIDDVDADGELALWLRLPTIDAAGSPVVAWLYYGQPEASPGRAPAEVWNGYISVHHLGSDLRDSAHEHHGSSQWEPEPCTGDDDCSPRIGVARSFVPELLHEVVLADHQAYDLGHDPYDDSISFTVSLWMRSPIFGQYDWGALVAKGDDTWRLHVTNSTVPADDDRIALGLDCYEPECAELDATGVIDMDSGNYNLFPTPAELPTNLGDNGWHQVVATFEALDLPAMPPPDYVPTTQARLFVDGQLVTASPELLGFVLPTDDQPVRLGHNINTGNRWGGVLDELRISVGARSAAAIASDYATVTADHVTVGEEQRRCP